MIDPSAKVIQQILDDDDVDDKLKTMLRSDDDLNIHQALIYISSLYPEKYGTIDDDLHPHTASKEYEKDFRSIMAQNTYEANPSEAIEKFIDWLEGETSNPSPAMMNHFKSAIASYFETEPPFQELGSGKNLGNYFNKDELDLKDHYFIDHIPSDPLSGLIVDEYLNLGIMAPGGGGLYDPDLWENLYWSIGDHVDFRGGLELARDELIKEGIIDDKPDIVIFYNPSGWLEANGY